MVKETTQPGNNGLGTIYRQNAVNALNTTSDDEIRPEIISPSHWLWILACALFLTGLFLWVLFGKISLTIEAQGMLFTASQLLKIENAIMQRIKNKEDEFNELNELYNRKLELFNNHYITRTDLLHAKKEYLTAKENLDETLSALQNPAFQNESNGSLIALMFVNFIYGHKMLPKMPSQISSITHLSYQDGYTSGHIIAISKRPASKQLAYAYLDNMMLVETYFSQGLPYIVKIKLNKTNLQAGMPVKAKIIYMSCTPLQLLLKSDHCD